VIDIDGKLKDPLKNLNSAKKKSPIILIDPIDNSRNATAALNKEKFELLKEKAQEFIQNPSIDFFRVKKMCLKDVKEKYKKEWGFFFSIIPLSVNSKDIQGTAILKAMEFIYKDLKNYDFNIVNKGFDFEHIYLIIKKEELSEYVEHRGPFKRQRNACKDFLEKHKGRKKIYDKNHRLYIRLKRKYKEPTKLVEKLIKDPYVTSRVKSIKILKRVR
jgi:tRNA nucleotidyltransferase (CCA-adding enzyme)